MIYLLNFSFGSEFYVRPGQVQSLDALFSLFQGSFQNHKFWTDWEYFRFGSFSTVRVKNCWTRVFCFEFQLEIRFLYSNSSFTALTYLFLYRRNVSRDRWKHFETESGLRFASPSARVDRHDRDSSSEIISPSYFFLHFFHYLFVFANIKIDIKLVKRVKVCWGLTCLYQVFIPAFFHSVIRATRVPWIKFFIFVFN